MPAEESAESGSIASRLNHLFATVHPADRAPYTNPEVAQAINEKAGHQVLGPTYLWQLRKGKRTDPTHSRLTAIADFFGVSPLYFYEEETAQRTNEQLRLAGALRNASIRQMALDADGLSERSMTAIAAMIQSARAMEGLPDSGAAPE
ncbi:helix-turn-helix domain-containing protein [Kitasatospora sp. NPDC088779]|uniref:helix-turn-helix domain-containing protein n=1 Tax=Kitasatospora sp. NPDC088779 TaxID=3154964 RepID=UPI00343BF2A5